MRIKILKDKMYGMKNLAMNCPQKHASITSGLAPNTGLPTSLRFVKIAFGDFGNPGNVRRNAIEKDLKRRPSCQ
jgi:hypothetical protein